MGGQVRGQVRGQEKGEAVDGKCGVENLSTVTSKEAIIQNSPFVRPSPLETHAPWNSIERAMAQAGLVGALGTGFTAGPTNKSCRPRYNSSVLDVETTGARVRWPVH